MDDFFAELNAEIASTLDKQKKARELETSRKKSNNTRLPPELRARAKARFQELNSELQAELWEVSAHAVMYLEQHCTGCGSNHSIFLQYMEKLSLKSNPRQIHYRRLARPLPNVPKEILIQPSTTFICPDCGPEYGFSGPEAGLHILQSRDPVLPSLIQGDINAPSEED